ncbi:MAG: hypothetical protein SGBAC_008789 [Bacillariaceae sp.]
MNSTPMVTLNTSLTNLCIDSPKMAMAQHERIRMDMQHRLLGMVQSKFPETPYSNHSAVAKVLDVLLYRAAPSFENYSDLTTLEKRIQVIVTKKLQQKQHKQHKQHTLSTASTASTTSTKSSQKKNQNQQSQHAIKKNARKQVLQDILKEEYETAQELVRDIKLAKNRKVATFKCFGGVCVRQSPSFQDEFPKEIKALFFGTALVTAFDKTPVHKLSSRNWKHLIQVAQTNLDAYKASPHCVHA